MFGTSRKKLRQEVDPDVRQELLAETDVILERLSEIIQRLQYLPDCNLAFRQALSLYGLPGGYSKKGCPLRSFSQYYTEEGELA